MLLWFSHKKSSPRHNPYLVVPRKAGSNDVPINSDGSRRSRCILLCVLVVLVVIIIIIIIIIIMVVSKTCSILVPGRGGAKI